MKKIHAGLVLAGLCLASFLGGGLVSYWHKPAGASRNSAGTMSTINTFVSGTTISSTNVNANFADIATEITDSLDRSGKGPMLAPLRLTNGTFAAPSLNFDSDTDTGLYRIGANNLGVTANGAKVLDVATTGLGVTGTLTTTGLLTSTVAAATSIKGLSGAAGSVTDLAVGRTATEGRLGVSAGVNNYAVGSAAGDIILGTLGSKLWFDTNTGTGTPSLSIAAANGTVAINNGLTIGSSGTAISASYRGTSAATPGSISANVCATIASPTVTGAASGADCLPIIPAGLAAAGAVAGCSANLNSCDMWLCNVKTVSYTPPAGTYGCRVFNP